MVPTVVIPPNAKSHRLSIPTSLRAGSSGGISHILQTMANKGYNPLVDIQMALSGQADSQPGE